MSQIRFVELQPEEGAERVLKDGATIGRKDCDVTLPDDAEVSRRHAVVRIQGVDAAVEDLGSGNGTFVNGERIEVAQALRSGDVVRFGATEWRFEHVGPAAMIVEAPAPAEQPGAAPAERDAEPVAPGQEGQRGDVPAPADPSASAVRPAPVIADLAPQFPPSGRQRAVHGSAARSAAATVFCFAVIFATAIALALYFALR